MEVSSSSSTSAANEIEQDQRDLLDQAMAVIHGAAEQEQILMNAILLHDDDPHTQQTYMDRLSALESEEQGAMQVVQHLLPQGPPTQADRDYEVAFDQFHTVQHNQLLQESSASSSPPPLSSSVSQGGLADVIPQKTIGPSSVSTQPTEDAVAPLAAKPVHTERFMVELVALYLSAATLAWVALSAQEPDQPVLSAEACYKAWEDLSRH